MTQRLVLSGPEIDLILELLESEQKELLVEIRHTDHAGLKDRLTVVESLIHQAEALAHAEQLGLGNPLSSAKLRTKSSIDTPLGLGDPPALRWINRETKMPASWHELHLPAMVAKRSDSSSSLCARTSRSYRAGAHAQL
jgi:hypothetical protein